MFPVVGPSCAKALGQAVLGTSELQQVASMAAAGQKEESSGHRGQEWGKARTVGGRRVLEGSGDKAPEAGGRE